MIPENTRREVRKASQEREEVQSRCVEQLIAEGVWHVIPLDTLGRQRETRPRACPPKGKEMGIFFRWIPFIIRVVSWTINFPAYSFWSLVIRWWTICWKGPEGGGFCPGQAKAEPRQQAWKLKRTESKGKAGQGRTEALGRPWVHAKWCLSKFTCIPGEESLERHLGWWF